jgi:carbon-monoxide dehydrogenase medium subunit
VRFVPTAGFIPSSFRTIPPFRLVRATTVAEAVSALAAAESPAVLAGGTDLPARFNEGFCPTDLIDISRIESLREIRLANGAVEIGATVTHASGTVHLALREHLSGFAAAWSRIANVRIRMSATLGGNLMARRTRYEGSILLSALGARVRFATAAGETETAVEHIWAADLPRGALLTTIVIPLRKGLRLDYARDLRPIMTQAVARDGAGEGRIVTSTEHIVPLVRALADESPPTKFGDPVTGDAYLRNVSATLLSRQLERMRAA